MGLLKFRQLLAGPGDQDLVTKVGSASSAGTTVGSRGIQTLATASSAGATAPLVVYLATPKVGDHVLVACKAAAASSNSIVLRTASSAWTFDGTNDQLTFQYPSQSIELLALSTGRWLCLGPVSTGPVLSTAGTALHTITAPVIGVSTS